MEHIHFSRKSLISRAASESGHIAIMGAALIAVLALVGLGLGRSKEKATLSLVAEGSRFVQRSEHFNVVVALESPKPMNAVSVLLGFPPDLIEVANVYKEDGAISLWVQEPVWSDTKGTLQFAGGMIGGFQGGLKLLTIEFRPKSIGEAALSIEDALVLAHDGEGTDILSRLRDLSYYIRKDDIPSPDLNDDNIVTLYDLKQLLLNIGTKKPEYDLNGDGKVGGADLSIILVRLMRS